MNDFETIRKLARETQRLRWAMERQRARAVGVTRPMDGMPGGGSGQRMEEDVVRLTTLQAQYQRAKQRLEDARGRVRPGIEDLEDATERAVMELRYMQDTEIGEIADGMHYSERQVFRILRRAERRIGNGNVVR